MRKKHILVLALLLAAAAGWTWRYITTNAYYDSLVTAQKEMYSAGEIVPFEDDLGEMRVNLDGYSLRVDRFEVLDFDTYIDSIDFTMDENFCPGDRVALLHITLFNADSDAEGIMLTDFNLSGVDTTLYLDWDLLLAANPVLNGSYGIRLSPGTEYSVVLPYKMQKEFFGSWTWNHFADYKLFFRMTLYPTEKVIQVQ